MRRLVLLTVCAVMMAGWITAGCAMDMGMSLPDAFANRPRVLEHDPPSGTLVPVDARVKLSFSLPIDRLTVGGDSIALVASPPADETTLIKQVIKGDAQTVAGAYAVEEGDDAVIFVPDEHLIGGMSYAVVVTPRLLSYARVPFSQTEAATPTAFVSGFAADASLVLGSSPAAPTGSGGSPGGGEGGAAIARPTWLVISEVFYDVVGSDTNGDVFIELAGEPSTSIGGYEVALVNGADGRIYHRLRIPAGSVIPPDGVFVIADSVTGSPGVTNVPHADYVVNFDPQNGPDSIQLLDDAGRLIDVLGYGEPMVEFAENGEPTYEGTPAVDVVAGMSLARVGTIDTDDNSLDFVARTEPSPGVLDVDGE